MNCSDLLASLLERLATAGVAKALFSADEIEEWPAGALGLLVNAGMLQQAHPASVVECTGCEQNCLMPVHVFPAEDHRVARAFIACDKRDDIGRVPVDLGSLKAWQLTGALLAKTLAQLLGLTQAPQLDTTSKHWTLGVLKGKKHKSLVTLLAGDSFTLSLAGHTVPLIDVLAFEKNSLTLNKAGLIRRVNKPAEHHAAEIPEARRTRLKARIHAEKAKGTRAFLQVVAKEEGIAVSRLKQLIASKPDAHTA
ncbi:MAG: hypothetical protein WBX11_13985 [Thiobacillaceae bacterium]